MTLPSRSSASLTKRERCALRAFNVEGELNEGIMANQWPTIRNARAVANSLRTKGLVVFEIYLDDEAGYQLELTPLGLQAAAELAELDA